jgi:hypothetical protein
MRNLFLRYRWLCGLSSVLLIFVTSQAAVNPHEISKQGDQEICSVCHKQVPKLSDEKPLVSKYGVIEFNDFKLDGVAMCSSCHDINAYHKVNISVDFPVPADLPLTEDKEMVCLTCHYSHGKLESDRPQCSFSVMDRLLDAKRLHKSFLLRRNNSNGELCLTCHDPNEGPK